jgi:uncharacterized protein YrrD
MKLTTDARIITQEGKEIGNLDRFVIDPRTKQVTHIVFSRGLVDKVQYLVALPDVDYMDDMGVHLKALPVDRVEDLPLFKDNDYVITDERALLEKGYVSDDTVRSYYYYPSSPFGSAGMVRPVDNYIQPPTGISPTADTPAIPVSGEQPVVNEVEYNIPENTVPLKEGAKVFSNNEKQLGTVEKLFVDSKSARATHLLISKGLLLKEHKLVPVDWVSTIEEDRVYLSVDDNLVNRLPAYQE